VDTRGHKLEIHLLLTHKVFEDGGTFIVKTLKFEFEARRCRDSLGCFVGAKNFSGGAFFLKHCMDVVRVIVVEYKE
jgi:hypothetical protein